MIFSRASYFYTLPVNTSGVDSIEQMEQLLLPETPKAPYVIRPDPRFFFFFGGGGQRQNGLADNSHVRNMAI